MNDVNVGFYLGACSQGKACRYSIKDDSPAMMKSIFIVFVKNFVKFVKFVFFRDP